MVKTVYRVAIGLVWLATLSIGGAAATGNVTPSRVAYAGSTVERSGNHQIAQTATAGQLGLDAAYVDQAASVDGQQLGHSGAGGIVGLLVNHEMAVAMALVLLWIVIGLWAIRRGVKIRHVGRRSD